ncbi:O-antigen translocase [Hyunsoonleella sp. SJ7]|uniref:O-antigen translocase n=1 Tax=Hyunsoonleella aquatilis TaxID=2762758 RepID=A0A923KK48_9FLAO|nr:O-antigen translocase [Hyunsoonleella aquatilis]
MLKKVSDNPFLKVFSFNSVVVVGKLVASFIVSKVSAIYLGPSGYAIVGNLKNVLQGALGVTSTGLESGVIKYIAENKADKKQLPTVVASALALSLGLSLIVGLFFFVFSRYLSTSVLKDDSLRFVFKYLAILLPLISLSFLMVYIANGLQKFRLYTALITISNLLNAGLTFVLIYFYNLEGALMASIVVPSLSFISSLFFKDIRDVFLEAVANLKRFSSKFMKSIGTYVAMATYSSILLSLVYLFIRNKIIADIDTDTAGLWEAMNKISSFYMIFFSSLYTLYLLPQLSINKTVSGYYGIMKTYFKYLIPIVLALFLGLFLFRNLVIQIFLTDAFSTIEQFFYLQLIGDFIKIMAFSIAYQFHAKKMVRFYVITDAILYLSFYVLSLYFINLYSLHGVFYAYILSTILYLVAVALSVYFNNSKYLKAHV